MLEIINQSQTTKSLQAPNAEFRQALARVFQQKGIGFFQLPFRSQLWSDAEQLGSSLGKRFKKMVIVGMGGSSLGPKALYKSLGFPKSEHRLIFLDNLDQSFCDDFFLEHDLAACVFVYISKSGSTLETLGLANEIISRQKKQNLNWNEHSVVISELRSNPISDWARKNKLALLEIPEDVGGRFSVLTAVGLLPAAFMGHSLKEMETGARQALEDKEKVALFSQLAVASFQRQEWISFFWFYSSRLSEFGGWLQQLWAESLAKKNSRANIPAARVSTPMAAVGACDQHSILQQVMDGYKDKWVVFVRTESAERNTPKLEENLFSVHPFVQGKSLGTILAAQAHCTERALAQSGIETLTLTIPELSPASVSYLFMFFELVVATIAEHLDLNAYDQPGVELGKKLTSEFLAGKSHS